MKVKNDNKINIGSKNKISNSIIGNNIECNYTPGSIKEKNSWYSQLFWKIFIPVMVAVIAAIIIWKLGLS